MKIRKGLIIAVIISFTLVLPVHAETEGVPQQIADILNRLDNLTTIFASKSEVDTLKETISSQQNQIDELKKSVQQLQAIQERSVVKLPYTGMFGDGPGYGSITVNVGIPNINVALKMQDGGNILGSGFTGEDGKITFENVPLTFSMGQKKYAELQNSKYSGKVDVSSMPGTEETFNLPVSLN
jgi:hypothetical protein